MIRSLRHWNVSGYGLSQRETLQYLRCKSNDVKEVMHHDRKDEILHFRPRTDIDRQILPSKYEMQLENAITELKTTDNLMPFMDVNLIKNCFQSGNSMY